MKRTLSWLLILLCAPSGAAVLNLSWLVPVTYTDSITVLPASLITQTRITYGPCSATGLAQQSVTGQVIAQGGLQHAQTPDLPAGTWCFIAYTTAGGLESTGSNVASFTIPPPLQPPGPPTQLAVMP